jgi:hypothetical protein
MYSVVFSGDSLVGLLVFTVQGNNHVIGKNTTKPPPSRLPYIICCVRVGDVNKFKKSRRSEEALVR